MTKNKIKILKKNTILWTSEWYEELLEVVSEPTV